MARAEIARREADVHKQLTRQDDERTYGRQFAEISQAHAPLIQKAGVHPLRLYQDFLGIMGVLNGNDPASKAALLRDVAMRNGLDMRSLLGLPPGQQPNQGQPAAGNPSPGTASIPPQFVAQVNELQARLDRQQQADTQRTQQQEAEQQQQTLDAIQGFRSKPENRFFDSVRDHMIALLNSNAATTLEEAYEAACWARPDIRSILQTEANAKAAAEQKKRDQVAKARLKSGSVRGGSGSVASGAPQERSLRDELTANFAEARARV